MGIWDSIKKFANTVVDDIRDVPHEVSVVVGGVEHVVEDDAKSTVNGVENAVSVGYVDAKAVIGDMYGAGKTVVGDVYGAGKTALTDSINLAGMAEKQALSPFTGIVDSFGYPVLFIGGALGFYIIYEMSQTSRQALPYIPSIMESAGRVAPLFGAI